MMPASDDLWFCEIFELRVLKMGLELMNLDMANMKDQIDQIGFIAAELGILGYDICIPLHLRLMRQWEHLKMLNQDCCQYVVKIDRIREIMNI